MKDTILGILIAMTITGVVACITYGMISSDKLNYQFQTDCIKAGGTITIGPSYNKICTNTK